MAGDNTITDNIVRNRLPGDDGNDQILIFPRGDQIEGGNGSDTIRGGDGADMVFGGLGDDRVIAGSGNDTLDPGAGSDTAFGSLGNDIVYGGAGDETIWAGPGYDLILSEAGNDVVHGSVGGNFVNPGAGDDIFYASVTEGDNGQGIVTGGDGTDVFVFVDLVHTGIGMTRDVILDFMPGSDRIDLSGLTLEFIGEAAFSAAARLRYIQGVSVDGPDPDYLIGDVNGDGVHDFIIHLRGASVVSIVDLIL